MRAAVLRDGRMIYRDDVPDPVPESGQVLVGVRACGICGSDLHFAAYGANVLEMGDRIAGGAGGMQVDLNRDVFMGHEFSAEILEAGPDTETHPPGTLVTSLPVLLSAKGVEPIIYSNNTIGGYAERMLLSALLLQPIPNGVSFKYAALTEPMAVGLHAVNKSNIAPGEKALVLGCGPIGMAIIAALRARGVETIAAADFSPKRRELATAMGAHQVLDPVQGSPFDSVKPAVVFEAVGVPGIIDDVLSRARPGTRLVVAGVCMQPDTVYPFFAIAKEINVQFVLAYTPEEFAESLRAIAEGDIDVAPLITGEVGLDGVGRAFDDLADPERHCKILVTPWAIRGVARPPVLSDGSGRPSGGRRVHAPAGVGSGGATDVRRFNVTRYRDRLQPDDTAAIWVSGRHAASTAWRLLPPMRLARLTFTETRFSRTLGGCARKISVSGSRQSTSAMGAGLTSRSCGQSSRQTHDLRVRKF